MAPRPRTAYCPQCGRRPLEHCQHEGTSVAVCPRCGGLWCEPGQWDRDKLGPLPGADAGEGAPETVAQVLFGPEGTSRLGNVDLKTRIDLLCPTCRCLLTAVRIDGSEGCEIDQCPRCGGIWLDRGEWDHLEALQTLKQQEADLDRPTTWGEWAFQFFSRLPVEFNIEPRRFPVVTFGLVVVCTVVFGVQLGLGEEVWIQWAMVPQNILAGRDLYTLVTNIFLHAGWFHLLGNMYFLYILGDNVEDVLGRGPYLLFYLFCGLASDGLELLFNGGSTDPSLGASGAIAGVMAAYFVLFRQARLTFMLVIWQFKVPAWIWIGFWFGFQLLGAFVDPHGKGGVGFLAHVGGFVAGLLLVWPFQQALLARHPLLRILRTRKPQV
jgi:membrane associated rhomboid family serine protease